MEPSPAPTPTPTPDKQKLQLSLDLRVVCVALLVIVIVMLALWRPWQSVAHGQERTISVTGQSTVKAEPDEYQFNPTWQFKNADKQAAIDAAGVKQTEVTAKLKALGVKDSQLKSNVYGSEDYTLSYPVSPSSGRSTPEGYVYTLSMTITQPDKASVQKIQDYLTTTSPQGSVTPYPTFSDAKQKQLEAQARNTATRDARTKADQSAKNLGFKIAGVKSVDDGNGLGGVYPLARGTMMSAEDSKSSAPSITVQPGENELDYSVTVVYFIR